MKGLEREPLSCDLHLRVSRALHAKLLSAANDHQVSLSEITRHVLALHADQYRKDWLFR